MQVSLLNNVCILYIGEDLAQLFWYAPQSEILIKRRSISIQVSLFIMERDAKPLYSLRWWDGANLRLEACFLKARVKYLKHLFHDYHPNL